MRRHLINIHIFAANNQVNIGISSIQPVDDLPGWPLLQDDLRAIPVDYDNFIEKHTYQGLLDDALRFSNQDECQKVFQPVHQDPIYFYQPEDETQFVYSSIVYQLPAIVHITINWIMCFSQYVNWLNQRMITIQFRDNNLLPAQLVDSADKQHKYLPIKLENFINQLPKSEAGSVMTLLEKLAVFKPDNQPSVSPTRRAILFLLSAYKLGRESNKPLPLLALLTVELQAHLFWRRDNIDLFNADISMAEKLERLVPYMKQFITTNATHELSYILKNFAHLAKVRLYEPALAIMARDKVGTYNWAYTEWEFLKHANVVLTADMQMAIVDIQNNPGYQEYYAFGKKNHSVFQQEIDYLFRALGFEFLPSCDVHQSIVFTRESSLLLKEKGLHFTEAYFKRLLYTHNNLRLFARSTPLDPQSSGTTILDLPTEVQEKVLEHAMSFN